MVWEEDPNMPDDWVDYWMEGGCETEEGEWKDDPEWCD